MSRSLVEAGISFGDETGAQTNPTVLRDKRGRVIWHLPGNSPEQNEQLGIRNIQGLFLEKFPEFDELFPRDNDGLIPEKRREDAARYILELMTPLTRFTTIFGYSPVLKPTAPYFEGSYLVAIRKSFAPLGIDINTRYETMSISVINRNGTIQDNITLLSQIEGIEKLREFLDSKRRFDEVEAFFIQGFGGRRSHKSGISLGRRFARSYLHLNKQAYQVLARAGILAVIPQGNDFYKWLNFCEISNNTIDLRNPIDSYALTRGDASFDESLWHGPDQQLFLDFLSSALEVSPLALREFKVGVNGDFGINLGRIRKKNISISLDTSAIRGCEVTVRPKYNPIHDYMWIEGYVQDEQGNEHEFFSRRFYKGDIKFYVWKGLEMNALIDWILGTMPFHKVSLVRARLTNSKSITLLKGKENDLEISLGGNSVVSDCEEILLIPSTDGLYEWIEVCKLNEDSGGEPEYIASYRVTRDSNIRLNGFWPGSEKQRFKDFLDGVLDAVYLKPIKAVAMSHGRVNLFTLKGKQIVISVSAEKITVGEQVLVCPTVDQNGRIIIAIQSSRDGRLLKKMQFDSRNMGFVPLSEDMVISPNEAREALERLLEEHE